MTIEEDLLKTKVGPQWSRIGIKNHHGIDVPLSALHSNQSCGIGEFYDLLPMIDWCKKVGMDVIQLLPLNDTGDDTSPFFALSAMALNPLFLSMHKLDGIEDSKLQQLRHFNTYNRVPFREVQSHKSILLRNFFDERGSSFIKEKKFSEFLEKNDWVKMYALFKVLKDLMSKNDWRFWPVELRDVTREQRNELLQKYWNDASYYIFLQYLCHHQLSEVKNYANEKGIFLKGDIPILISPDSADVWEYTDEFDLSITAGAPPDRFNSEGQVWGLPIFRWEVMKQHNYDWWRKRLKYAENFYDIYRIDHVLGFFRIWAIPQGKPSSEGRFIPENEADWFNHGKDILSVLVDFTPMLPIAEDLGVVPDSIRACLSELGICGTKVIRWETHNSDGKTFIDLLHYNPTSMTTVSTHDSTTLELWWNNPLEEAKEYAAYKGWDYSPNLSRSHRKEILWDSHHSSSLFHINLLGEYLALFPELVWDNPFDERINLPGTVAPSNWTYRIRPTVETILSHEPLAQEVKSLL